jgi:hypothetical protein
MAMAMIEICCASPTAVMTESSENTISRIAIWISTAPMPDTTTALIDSTSPSRLV